VIDQVRTYFETIGTPPSLGAAVGRDRPLRWGEFCSYRSRRGRAGQLVAAGLRALRIGPSSRLRSSGK